MTQTFLNCVSKFDLTDVLGSIYDRKTAARPFDTIYDILRSLSVAQSLLKGQNSRIWRVGNRGVNCHLRRINKLLLLIYIRSKFRERTIAVLSAKVSYQCSVIKNSYFDNSGALALCTFDGPFLQSWGRYHSKHAINLVIVNHRYRRRLFNFKAIIKIGLFAHPYF